jgi:alpha-tubulin suppressor-like RCC1 family protein
VQITAGYGFQSGSFCALITDGTVKCWGSNNWYQLGDGSDHFDSVGNRASSEPVPVSGITDAVSIGAGESMLACAVLAGGGVKCWG